MTAKSHESPPPVAAGATGEDLDAEVPGLAVSVGDPIPSIGLRASDGYLLNLRSFVGKQPVALLFFAAPTADGTQARRGIESPSPWAPGLGVWRRLAWQLSA